VEGSGGGGVDGKDRRKGGRRVKEGRKEGR
jgi:hypothetical protein